MMQKSLIVILTYFTLLIVGCDSGNEKQVDSVKLHRLIVQAIAGDEDANIKLNGMISAKHLKKNDYNQVSIDSFQINDQKYYSVLIEYYDPTLNLFSIYDKNLNFYLLDKSLNGNLSVEWAVLGTRIFVFLQERFLTKDVLGLDRLTIYEVFDNSASLIYRSLSRFVKGNEVSHQTVERITRNFIVTKLSVLNDQSIDDKPDTFYFSLEEERYLSKWNFFNKFVRQQIREFNWVTTKPQIPSDMLEDSNFLKGKSYQISLNIDWEEIPSYVENKFLKKSLTGTKFYNKSLNSSFTILEIPSGEISENYSPYSFGKATTGNYQKRETTIYDKDNNYYQHIEHSCGNKKFLLLFECPKAIYMKNKKDFKEMINSFSIKC